MLKPFDETVTATQFRDAELESVLASCDRRQCYLYSLPLLAKSREASEAGDTTLAQIFLLLGWVTSLHLKLDTPEEPFGPQVVFRDGRSAIVDDFDPSHLAFLDGIVVDILDPELRARVADILWLRTRNYRHAEIAVSSYLASATFLGDTADRVLMADPIERAFQIATPLGRKSRPYPLVVKYVEDALASYENEAPQYLSVKLMELLVERREGDPRRYTALAETLALRAEATNDWEVVRRYWDIGCRWHVVGKDDQAARQARIMIVESYVKQAGWILSKHPQYSLATHWIQCAVMAARQIPELHDRTQELHRLLLNYQEKSVGELKPISAAADVSEIVATTIDAVKGKPLADALMVLAMLGRPMDVDHLRAQAVEYKARFVFRQIMPRTYLNAMGRVIANQPRGEEDELLSDMFEYATCGHSIHVRAFVEPARHQILSEHYVRLADLASFVVNNLFVRSEREMIVLRGLHAGLHGDILTAVHLLIPQLEDSLRYILSHMNVITSGLDDDGIQDEYNVNKMLSASKYTGPLATVLGKDMVFDLRCLLVERTGANLRNDMAHGLLGHSAFYNDEARYLWWLALRFYAWPTASGLRLVQQGADDGIST